ncbi:hypothetical protein SPRG_08886 [Saprolegnia parasitica CBS 223.65]|uniref:Tyrosine-protein kinase ephrin type A/B receptor-like domain-containing protein n=1 Tax=Saprolegnia parasitica (strain CBS 223.65) TaxID=695850 RepID=A0A067CFK3_SAPPC|nr:hypothetical protein SPRG_08886 [Saprolegnia parasitica CBS 223.65]KDO25587.1 hypothetical protein SPRG_08886 [Saprolegnia parasitica CBS 223.65]|eukprot:XP_012203621.1 hypothetical protein SPRG_08886 [Saprolegnia parasitica CBS 223.65]
MCPMGSASPRVVPPGMYLVPAQDPTTLSVTMLVTRCPPGSYCVYGQAFPCPVGRFGATEGLNSSRCSDACPSGSLCVAGTVAPMPCSDPASFCPAESYALHHVGVGNYSIPLDSQYHNDQAVCEPGHYCIDGVRSPCPAGTFGSAFGLTTPACSGQCAPGYHCPQGSLLATANECGSPHTYCPEGSPHPQFIASGYCGVGTSATTQAAQALAPPGSFALEGQCYSCPGGSYGTDPGSISPTCSGVCAPGYYCPPGSTSPFQVTCGLGAYCPTGSASPLSVTRGFYSYIATTDACGPGLYRSASTSLAALLLAGWSAIAVDYGDALFPYAPCVPCPLGTFKPDQGDDQSLCLACPLFTSTSSIDRTTCTCYRVSGGAAWDATTTALYFDGVDCIDLPVSTQMVSLLAPNSSWTKDREAACEPGYYCVQGAREPCPAGRYGTSWKETNPLCTDACRRGHYCPVASAHDAMKPCGAPYLYCPSGSPYPVAVTAGYYSLDSISGLFSDLTRRDAQAPCEPGAFCKYGLQYPCPGGRYGSAAQETSSLCTGLCQRGFYCPPGSTRPTQVACGNASVICRRGSAVPEPVAVGYYSGGDTSPTEALDRDSMRWYQLPCPLGSYCVDGTSFPCPGGTYGGVTQLTRPTCSGLCAPGYYCPPGSVASQAFSCGNVSVYCPPGSTQPLAVSVGYYTTGGTNSTRSGQALCPIGSFCQHGVLYQCPSGTYGSTTGLTVETCSGWCRAGYFCPPGTVSATANACGPSSYSIDGQGDCMACPSARPAMPCQNRRACCQ